MERDRMQKGAEMPNHEAELASAWSWIPASPDPSGCAVYKHPTALMKVS
jgi:hypothetical protein